MSKIKVDQIESADGVADITLNNDLAALTVTGTSTLTGNVTASGDVTMSSMNGGQLGGRRNLIMNGGMTVAQRGTSSTGITSGGYYTVDRFRTAFNGSPDELEFTQEQSTDAPTGFSNSLKLTVTTTETTLAADERVRLQQRIEGQNLQHLKYGTSDAEYLTLSFYVKSNVTGTYGIHFDNKDSSRSICSSYTISAANTWEKKTVSIAGDTTGSFDNDTARSLDVCWVLAAGTDYTSGTFATSWESDTSANQAPSGQADITDTVSNYFQITGVQLEVGDTATSFENRSYAEELSLCQRYYSTVGFPSYSTFATGQFTYNPSTSMGTTLLAQTPGGQMRVTPTMTFTQSVSDYYARDTGGGTKTLSGLILRGYSGGGTCQLQATSASSFDPDDQNLNVSANGANFQFDAEL